MTLPSRRTRRGAPSLSRDTIVAASIALLDSEGEAGLTFRALAQRLETGAGALYWHVADKSDLLVAASDAIVTRALAAVDGGATPQDRLRAVALAVFDAIDAHPWVGSALHAAPGQMPMVRILERIGREVQAMGVPAARQWTVTSALLSYILGVSGINAANAQFARARGMGERAAFLGQVAAQWLALDAEGFAFTRAVAGGLSEHDDREDFLVGVGLILGGILVGG